MGFKGFIRLCFVLVLFTAFTGCKKEPDKLQSEEEIIEALLAPTVMITVGDSHASGVIIENSSERIVIASVSHLTNGDYDQGIITFSDNHAGFADVMVDDAKLDVCLLSIKKSEMDASFAESLETAKIDIAEYENLVTDDEVFVVGSLFQGSLNVTKGKFKAKDYYVPEFDQYMMYLYCDVFEGFSGSGVYNRNGYLVGLLAGGSDNSEAVCVPITDVYNLLNGGK